MNKTLFVFALAVASAVASPVADVSDESGLRSLEARKVCGAGYLACHYRFPSHDPDQAEYTCMDPDCADLRDCTCPRTASFNNKAAFLFGSGCRSKAAAGNHPKCFVILNW
ncbi:hypothetical protein BDP67DRAFT_575016 [Colletotrichum lupini]|nr:hypothetical protein BDP67DRAFT_575016 [Colletotrichum lupini]